MSDQSKDKLLQSPSPTVYREMVGIHGQRKLVQESIEEATVTPFQRAYVWALDVFSIKPTVEANMLDILQTSGLVIPAATLAAYLISGSMWVAGVLVSIFIMFFVFYFGILVAANSPMGWTYFWLRLFVIITISALMFV